MEENYIERLCPTCGKILSENNKSGYCNKHRDRTGINNPFWHHKQKPETIAKMKENDKIALKKVWENKEYRDKVIKGMSKPRGPEFAIEQSKRITQWYIDHPEQKTIRSKSMTKSWETGAIISNNFSCNRSDAEIDFYDKLNKVLSNISHESVKIGPRHWALPDIILKNDGVIIEFFGNYWHANPEFYDENDIIHDGIKAIDIWQHDKERIDELEYLGYTVYIVWENDYKEDPESIINYFDLLYNWESCAI